GERTKRRLDVLRIERLDGLEGVVRSPGDVDVHLAVDLDGLEQEARVGPELAERRDLLLDERCGPADELLVPVEAALAEVGDEPVSVFVRGQITKVDAVEVLELLVVEDGWTRSHPLQREALDQLGHGHDLGPVVVAPAEEREVVDERLRDVALSP